VVAYGLDQDGGLGGGLGGGRLPILIIIHSSLLSFNSNLLYTNNRRPKLKNSITGISARNPRHIILTSNNVLAVG